MPSPQATYPRVSRKACKVALLRFSEWAALTVGDVSGDGLPDVVILGAEGLSVLVNGSR